LDDHSSATNVTVRL